MRFILLIAGAAVAGLALWLWGFGGSAMVASWAASAQQDVQRAMATGLRALRAGEPGALLGLLTLCFSYGFFHAVGPGHGKLLIGGYGVGRRVSLWRLTGLSTTSSLAQSLTAVVLVYGGLWAFGWGRSDVEGLSENFFLPLSYAAVALIGAWLLWRGVRKLWQLHATTTAAEHSHSHDHHNHGGHHDHGHDHTHHHHHHDDGVCASCGHAHGPTLEQVEQVHTIRDGILLVGAIAMRPCSGALFLLILTWRFGLYYQGVLGAFAMGLGTASVTVAVAIGSVTLRESILRNLSGGVAAQRMMGIVEALAGAVVLALSLQILSKFL